MRLYFPTSSLNFNDMLATESISPIIFYSKRRYGTKRHFSTELALNENFLTLFSVPPMFELVERNNSEYEEYPIILEINLDETTNSLHKVSNNIYVVPETIYFSPGKIKFNFVSEDHVKRIVSKSKLVEETKLIPKYRDSFRLMNRHNLIKIQTEQIPYPPVNIEYQNCQIINDHLFNKLKGLVYSFLIKYYESYSLNSISILGQINQLIDTLSGPTNHYFEIARDQIAVAKKYYEKGINLEQSRASYPQIIDFYNKDELLLNKNLLPSFEEYLLYSMIINYLFKNHESDNYLNKLEIENFINNLISIIKTKHFEPNYIQSLLQIQDRIISKNYQATIDDISSSVLQNLFVFLLRQDKVDELDQILKDNSIKENFITYSFIGITTGFSNLSRIITSTMFNNVDLSKEIENQVTYIFQQIWKNNKQNRQKIATEELINEPELFPSNNEVDKNKQIEIRITDNIQKIRESKVIKRLLSKKQFQLNNGVQVIFEEIDGDVFIHFDKDKSNYIYIILRNKKNRNNKEEISNFKNRLFQLGYRKSDTSRVAQGNYPIFFYFKVIENKDETLSIYEKKLLLKYLDLLVDSQ